MESGEGSRVTDKEIKKILTQVINNLDEMGYNAVKQIAGYLQSGDLGYIPNYKNSRNIISELDRNQILEVLIKSFL